MFTWICDWAKKHSKNGLKMSIYSIFWLETVINKSDSFSFALWTFCFNFSNIFYDNILINLFLLHLNSQLIPDRFSPISGPANAMGYLKCKSLMFQGLIWLSRYPKKRKNSIFFTKSEISENWFFYVFYDISTTK